MNLFVVVTLAFISCNYEMHSKSYRTLKIFRCGKYDYENDNGMVWVTINNICLHHCYSACLILTSNNNKVKTKVFSHARHVRYYAKTIA